MEYFLKLNHIYNKNGGNVMENIFNVSYNSKLDKLEIRKEKKVNKLIKSIQKNKFISLIFASFILLSGINFYLIYNFMKILENI